MITLPAKDTDEGAKVRLLLAECRGPSFAGFSQSDAVVCMQLMDLVLHNRAGNPHRFLAKEGTLLAVIRAKGQFQGFEGYPHYDARIAHNIQQMVNIANNPKDKRRSSFADFVNAAIAVARAPQVADPSPGKLSAWRTTGSGSPGPDFKLYKTVFGTDFYYVESK